MNGGAEYSKFPDGELALLVRAGDHAAFTEIFNRYSALLYVHAFNKLRDENDARDVVQEMFINLWAKKENLDVANNLSGYLYTAVRNNIFNFIKHQKVTSAYAEKFSGLNQNSEIITDHLVRERQFAAIIAAEIALLPPRMREIFELRQKEHLSNREIAQKLGLAESTVADQMKKALKTLRLKLGLMIFTIFF